MTTRFLAPVFGALLIATAGAAHAGPIAPFDSCLNINGAIHDIGVDCAFDLDGAAPGNVTDDIETNLLAADSGLGSVTVTLSDIGDFFVGLFVDWEIDEAINTFFNEDFGSGGTAAAGQTFEVDEPGYGGGGYFGDIFFNFEDGLLDGAFLQDFFFGDSGNAPEDISMALGWDFSLTAGQSAIITFLLSDTQPGSGLWLSHSDPESEVTFFFSSTLEILGDEPDPPPPTAVPEPGTLILFGSALLGLRFMRRRPTPLI